MWVIVLIDEIRIDFRDINAAAEGTGLVAATVKVRNQ